MNLSVAKVRKQLGKDVDDVEVAKKSPSDRACVKIGTDSDGTSCFFVRKPICF